MLFCPCLVLNFLFSFQAFTNAWRYSCSPFLARFLFSCFPSKHLPTHEPTYIGILGVHYDNIHYDNINDNDNVHYDNNIMTVFIMTMYVGSCIGNP